MNVSRAEKLPFFPGYYFLMMSSILQGAEQPFSTRAVVPDGPGKTSLIESCRPVSSRRGRDFAYECCKEVEDDGAGIRDPRP